MAGGAHLRETRAAGRRRIDLVVAVSLLVGVAVGVGWVLATDDTGDADTAIDTGVAETPVTADARDSGVAAAVPDPGPITIAFVGDINAEGSLRDRLASDPEGFVGPFADVLRRADLAVGNLEAAVTEGGTALGKQFTFRVPPSILDALEAGGLDVVSAANNHGLDYGEGGLADTLAAKAARADGMLIGIGADEDEAYAPFLTEVGGQRIAVIAATQVIDGEYIASWTARPDRAGVASAKRVDRLVAEVETVRPLVDTVVVYLHWGVEGEVCPSSVQQELARALVDAGADIVVGGHAHRVQSGGRLGDAFVGYGLGNFLFGAVSEESAKTGVLLVTVDGREIVGYEWVPGTIVDRVPQPIEGDWGVAARVEWEERRACTGLAP